MARSAKTRAAILISGRGSNMRALIEAARAPDYPAEIVCVISNRPEAAGLAWAKKEGVPSLAIDHAIFPDRAGFEDQLHRALTAARAEVVACAGFMRLLSCEFVEKWRGRMLNIHPSLLPAFKGLNTHERAIAAEVKISGCTVHLVTADMDGGPILAQAAVPVMPNDDAKTLAARVLAAEHRLYPDALRRHLEAPSLVRGIGANAPVSGETPVLFSPALRS